MATETKIQAAKAVYQKTEKGETTKYFLTLSESQEDKKGFKCESIKMDSEENRLNAKHKRESENFHADLGYFKTIYGIKKLTDGEDLPLMHEEDYYKNYPSNLPKKDIAANRLHIVKPGAHQQHLDGLTYKEQIVFTSTPHPEDSSRQILLFKTFGYEPETLIDSRASLIQPEDKAKFIEREDLYTSALQELRNRMPERMEQQDKATQAYGEALKHRREEKLEVMKAAQDEAARKARKKAIRANIIKRDERKAHVENVQPDLLEEVDNKNEAHQTYLDNQEPMSQYANTDQEFTFDPDEQDRDEDFQR